MCRDLLYTTKSRDLLYPHEKCLCVSTTNPPLSLKFAFSLKPQIEVVICTDVSENRLPETKNNFSVYDISQPTHSVSLSVPSCSLERSNNIMYRLKYIKLIAIRFSVYPQVVFAMLTVLDFQVADTFRAETNYSLASSAPSPPPPPLMHKFKRHKNA